jgi:hypothetical protein
MHDVTARQNGTMCRFYCAAVGLNTTLNLGTYSSWYLIEVPGTDVSLFGLNA